MRNYAKITTIIAVLSLALSAWIIPQPSRNMDRPWKAPEMSVARFWTVWRWSPIVNRYTEMFDLDRALVLAVIARESEGNPFAKDGTGLGDSVGLMQVIPRTNYPRYNELTGPYGETDYDSQIYTGMWMLSNIIKKADGNIRYALAAYNCGFVSVDAGRCYAWGGYTYADDILNNIVPVFTAAIDYNWRPKSIKPVAKVQRSPAKLTLQPSQYWTYKNGIWHTTTKQAERKSLQCLSAKSSISYRQAGKSTHTS